MKKLISLLLTMCLLLSLSVSVQATSVADVEKPIWSYSGNGDDIISGFKTDNYFYALKVYHNDSGHFSVKGHYGEKSYDYDLLINTTKPYINEKTLLRPNRDYTFEVSAKGSWKMEVYSLKRSNTDSFAVKGDYVTDIFTCSTTTYQITTKGKGHISIKGIYGTRSYDYDLLVNTTDEDYSGKVFFKHKGKSCIFEITSEREVVITPIG